MNRPDQFYSPIQVLKAPPEIRPIYYWIPLFLALLGFAAGLFAKTIMGFDTRMDENWKLVFISMGSICLGFGAAALLYRHFRELETRALEAQYEALRKNADALVEELDRFENQKPAR